MLLIMGASLASPPAWLVRDDAPVPPDGRVTSTGERRALVRADPHALRTRGIRVLERPDGRVRGGLGWVAVEAPASSLAALDRAGFEVIADRRIDLGPPPMDVTGGLVGATAVRARPGGPTGAGMVVADIDTHLDLTHPHFFRADAGTFRWVDTDGDGLLTPGVDGLDRDGDGRIGPSETLERLEGFTWSWQSDGSFDIGATLDGFDPATDWLYLDLNGNGQRDSGVPGFTDTDPGLAEPTFVPDDVDLDGRIGPAERVWQLGTSVVSAVWHDGRIYRRGEDLLDYDALVVLTGEDPMHGTAVSGIVLGGQLPFQRRRVGLAPDADLVFVSRMRVDTLSSLAELLDVSASLGSDVVLHEYAPWLGFPLDGTGLVDRAVDDFAERGIAQVCAAGNLADAGKHGRLTPAGDGSSVTLEVRASAYGAPSSIWLEWHHRDPELRCALDTGGFTAILDTPDETVQHGEMWTWFSQDMREPHLGRSTVAVWRDDGYPLQPGKWRLSCDAPGPFDIYLVDGSGWSRGSVFDDEIRSATMGVPSTSKHCVAVGAYAGREGDGRADVGELRTWSSRGPTLTGRKTIDVAAPDDAYAPGVPFAPDTDGAYMRFSGTSGAAPHVAAIAALMLEHEPGLDGVEVRERLVSTAHVGDAVEPGDGWGAGAVDGYAAIYGEPTPVPVAVEPVTLHVDWTGGPHSAVARVSGASDLRWDLDYDGTIDATGPVQELPRGATVRIEAWEDGFRVGGLAIDGIPADPPERRSGGCATQPATGLAASGGLAWMVLGLGLLAAGGRGVRARYRP